MTGSAGDERRSVALFGATGFVGRHVARALERRGAEVRPVPSPQVTTTARDTASLAAEAPSHSGLTARLVEEVAGASVVVNAAGLATPTGGADDGLYGANALLPSLLSRVSDEVGARFVHVSTAAVQGRARVLDESTTVHPFSPYSASKALGERMVLAHPGHVVFRPTSVQGAERRVTASLRRIARSRLASVASPGTDPTPQVHVDNVADAIAFTALSEDPPPAIVLQPADGLTTASLLEILGGHRPIRVPRVFARGVVAGLFGAGRIAPRFTGIARRVEMLWFGQDQAPGWLDGRWEPVVGRAEWEALG
ncbi:NAD-dependent epimerase/dehydratase family protein [Brevibacterium litoralis]|uniref:NAD-dependent epimerase/dehydratase family protein n=1 Tax=Brevibacterium litoralis TaxID=3138935 RepID=UPI0032EBA36F